MTAEEGTSGKNPLISSRANALADVAAKQTALENALAPSGGVNALQAALGGAGIAGNALREAALGAGIAANATLGSLEMRNALAGLKAENGFAAEVKRATENARKIVAGYDSFGGLADVSERFSESNRRLKNALSGVESGGTLTDYLRNAATFGQVDALADLGYKDGVEERMKDLRDEVGERSALGKIAQDIAAQQRSLDDWSKHANAFERVDVPQPIHIPKVENPLVETNKRLARIEGQFEHVSQVARESAQIAVSLQAAAAELLKKFERAANDTNRSGSKAIRVGWLALAIAVVTAAAQIASPLFLPDYDAAALQQEVVNLTSEITGLRSEQAETSQRLIDALAAADHETAAAVREAVAAALSVQQEAAPAAEEVE